MLVSLRAFLLFTVSVLMFAGCGGANSLPYSSTNGPVPRAAAIYIGAAQVPGSIASVSATSNGTIAPATLISGTNTGLAYNYFTFIDSSGRLWATNCLSLSASYGPVVAFNAASTGNVAPVVSIQGTNTGLSGCQTGIATDASGFVYVADITNNPPLYPGGQIAIFAPGAQGNVAPARDIAGLATNLHSPTGVWVDPSANLYVADSAQGFSAFQPDVQVWAPGANGNVASSRVISGSNTSLAMPEGIVLDGAGYLYVANAGNDSITIFAPLASGNVAPSRIISGSNTQLDRPSGIAVDAAGFIYVGNQDTTRNAPVLVFGPNANGNNAPVQSITLNASNYVAPAGIAVR